MTSEAHETSPFLEDDFDLLSNEESFDDLDEHELIDDFIDNADEWEYEANQYEPGEFPFAKGAEQEDNGAFESAFEHRFPLNDAAELTGFDERELEPLFEQQIALNNLYEQKVKEGVDLLNSTQFGFPFRKGTYKPKSYWERVPDPRMLKWYHPKFAKMLRFQRPRGVSPADAIQSIVDHQAHWVLDCAAYIQVVQLYALSKMKPAKFNKKFKSADLLIRFHNAPGVEKKYTFRKHCFGGPWHAWYKKGGKTKWWPIKNTTKWNDRTLLKSPIGSRLMWRNKRIAPPKNRSGQTPHIRCSYDVGNASDSFRNENTVKYGPNLFRAWPLSTGPISEKKIRRLMAAARMGAYPDPSLSGISNSTTKRNKYADRNIYLCEVNIFRLPRWITI